MSETGTVPGTTAPVATGTSTPEGAQAIQAERDASIQDATNAQAESVAATEAMIGDTSIATDANSVTDARAFDAPALAQMLASTEGASPEALEYSTKYLSEKLGLSADEAGGIIYALQDGVNARNELQQMQVFEDVGGRKGFDELREWASTGLSKEALDQYNSMQENATSIDDYKALVGFLAEQRNARQGQEPERISGETPPEPRIKPITSRDEYRSLMRDPRYTSDPSFRDAVDARMEAGVNAGNYQIVNKRR